MTLMGQTAAGRYVYKCTLTRPSEAPQYLIISKSGGNTKIYDGVDFVNHGYYVEGQTTPTQVITATGIKSLTSSFSQGEGAWYTLDGRCIANSQCSTAIGQMSPGIYIRNGKKYVVK